MNAYLFTAVATRCQVRPAAGRSGTANTIQTWDASTTIIVLGGTPEEAQRQFEAWMRLTPEGENPVEVTIRKISAAQFVDQWFSEAGNVPLDWPKILKLAEVQLGATAVDDFEQGYWVNVDQVVRPERLSFSAGTLQSDVPEDIRSGLNWSGDRNFLFLVSVLAPLARQVMEDEPENGDAASGEREDENSEQLNPIGAGELLTNFPEALDKEAAALIQARNSVVAAWLWRRYAANTRLAANSIRIDPWCGAIGLTGAD
ncbi:MAG: hypothetical protein ABSE16_15070 [Verrucomicrobiota bacterium]|jgi:hypothetical protein